MYPYSLPSYYGPTVYGRGYIVPPVYHHAPPIPMSMRQDTPSCSWTVEPARDSDRRDDNSTGKYFVVLETKEYEYVSYLFQICR